MVPDQGIIVCWLLGADDVIVVYPFDTGLTNYAI